MSHEYVNAERNANVWISMRQHPTRPGDPPGDAFTLVRRPEARVSVFDSGFLLGDGVWEGAPRGVCAPEGVLERALPQASG